MIKLRFKRDIIIAILLSCSLILSSKATAQLAGKLIFSWLDRDIYVANADGSDPQVLAPGAAAREVVWSPDGSKIAYVGEPDEIDYEIFVMNADGSNRIQLTDNTANDTRLSWSPDGSKIAFTTIRDGNLEVYVMNADGSNQVNLTNHPARDAYPDWSPDGSKIVFASQRDGGKSELYVMNADGTNPVRLTNDPVLDDTPVWSPDGGIIAFRRLDPDHCEQIYTVNPDGSDYEMLVDHICDLAQIRWLPDGSGVLYQQYNKIYVAGLDGSGQEVFANLPGLASEHGPFDIYIAAEPTPSPSGIGIYGRSTGDWYLRNSASSGAPDYFANYGGAWALPVVGDWDANGSDTLGVYNPTDGMWYLRNALMGGTPDVTPLFGGSWGLLSMVAAGAIRSLATGTAMASIVSASSARRTVSGICATPTAQAFPITFDQRFVVISPEANVVERAAGGVVEARDMAAFLQVVHWVCGFCRQAKHARLVRDRSVHETAAPREHVGEGSRLITEQERQIVQRAVLRLIYRCPIHEIG